MFDAIFSPGYTCWTTVIFEMLQEGNLEIDSLALNNCFSDKIFFMSKSSNFVEFGPYNFVQIPPACGPNFYQIMYGETLDFQCQH